MDEKVENSKISMKTMLFLSILTLVFGWISAYSGEIILSFSISCAAFSCLLASFSDSKKRLTVLAVCGLLLTLPTVFFGLPYLGTSLGIFFFALILSYGFSYRLIKPDVVFISIIFLSLAFVAIGYVWIGNACGSFEKEAVISAVSSFVSEMKNSIQTYYSQPEMKVLTDTIGIDLIMEVFDLFMRLSVAAVAVFAFFVCGVTMKIFAFLWKKTHREDTYIQCWRFTVPSSFAYFYSALFIIQFFLHDYHSLSSLVILNLYIVFLVVFAYIGFRFLLFAISKKSRNKVLFYFLFFLGIILFSSVAVEIISLNGVLAVIIANRYSDKYSDL